MSGANPEKLFHKIGEAAELLNVKPSVLRFWESQFSALTPRKTRTGQRLYNQQEIELLLEIRRLLYGEKLTIEGARKRLTRWGKRQAPRDEPEAQVDNTKGIVREIQEELLQLKEFLER
ncbi:MAG TPA: MerR family transcriptional regulator [Geobacteraceae bacterium]